MFSPELKKGSFELMILSLLEAKPRHGYEIGKRIESRSGGKIQFHISSLYPVLARLEERGLIRGRWLERPGERRRRFYDLTGQGVRTLARKRETWREWVAAVDGVLGVNHG